MPGSSRSVGVASLWVETSWALPSGPVPSRNTRHTRPWVMAGLASVRWATSEIWPDAPLGLVAPVDRGTIVVLAGDGSWLASEPGSCAVAGSGPSRRTRQGVIASAARSHQRLLPAELA